MRVLFVSSGNSKEGISPIIKNQGVSLIDNGVELDFYTIKGKGFKGYLKSVLNLKNYLNNNSYDVIHAHYSLSAFVASLAGTKPLVVSLMGSDIKSSIVFNRIIKLFNHLAWSLVIVKSKDMFSNIKIKQAHIIPNGVDMGKFKPLPKEVVRNRLRWDNYQKRHVLFAANPLRYEKNYSLFQNASSLLNQQNMIFHYLNEVSQEEMPYYYNASDVIVLTSLWEGSPNVIKEAMACNIPIVSTDVGDVKEVIAKTKGCFISTFEPEDVAEKIQKTLDFGKRTTGREDIKHLESSIIARKIIEIYKSVLAKK